MGSGWVNGGSDKSLLVDFDDTMHNGDVSTLDLEHKNLTSLHGLILIVGEKKEVPTIECWLYRGEEKVLFYVGALSFSTSYRKHTSISNSTRTVHIHVYVNISCMVKAA